MKKLITLILILIAFNSYSQIRGTNENIKRMPKDTSKFNEILPKYQLVCWTDTTIIGYENIYRIYRVAITTESIRTLINTGLAKLVGGQNLTLQQVTGNDSITNHTIIINKGESEGDGLNIQTIGSYARGASIHTDGGGAIGFESYTSGDNAEGGLINTTGNESVGLNIYTQGNSSIPLSLNSYRSDTLALLEKTYITSQIIRGDGAIIAPNLTISQINSHGAKTFTNKEYTDSVVIKSVNDSNAILKRNTGSLFSHNYGGGSNANYSNFIGNYAGLGATNANYSNFIGYYTGLGATNASNSTLIGFHTGLSFSGNNIGANNIIIGTNISLPNATSNAINLGGVIFATGTNSDISGDPKITATTGAKVGINVVTPSEILEVNGNIKCDTLKYNYIAGGSVAILNGGTGTSTGSITGTGALVYAAGGTNQNVTLTPSGNGSTILNGAVGIGTTAPLAKLHIGSHSADTNLLTRNLILQGGYATTNVRQQNLMTFVGIDANYIAANPYNDTASGNDRNWHIGSVTNINTYEAPRFVFLNAGVEKMVITSNGNVGIGTTTIPSMLTVNGLINMKNYTVATLPAGTQGDICYVTDALAPAFLTIIVGGGTAVAPCFFNGINWVGF